MGIFNRKPETIKFSDLVAEIASKGEKEARNLSGVYQCIGLISNTISKLPFFVLDKKTKKEIEDSEIPMLLNLSPNSKMNASIFKQTVIGNLLVYGNSYILPKRKPRSFEITELEIVDPDSVSINETSDGKLQYVISTKDNPEKKLRYDEIVHIKINPTKDGIQGVSPLTYARLTTSVGLKQEEFQESFYDNGGRPDGVLKTQADLSDKKVELEMPDGSTKIMSMKDALRLAWEDAHSGSNKRFNIAVLDNGLEYSTIPQISPADMDFVNSKAANIEDICRYFHVPPYKLGVGKQTYSNNEQASIEYITNAIVPLVTQIEQELTIKLLTNFDVKKGYVIKCNVEAELRGDSSARGAWYKVMQTTGAYSINEIRAYEDLPEIKNGDARLVGANSTPLDLIVKGVTVPSNLKTGEK